MRKAISRQLRRWGLRGFNGRLNGRKFKIPARNGVRVDISEWWMGELLSRLLPTSPGMFLDVGVNLGQTLLTVASVDPDRAYVGFEPNPACVEYVQALIGANRLAHHRIIPAALSDRSGVVTLDLYHEATDSAASIIPEYRPGQKITAKRSVVALSPDDLPGGLLGQVGVVKIDVEGAEKEVLTGLEPILRRDRPPVIVEVLPPYSDDNHPRINRQFAIEALLESLDYVIYRLAKMPFGLDRIQCFGVHADLEACDYLLMPAERAKEIDQARVTA